MKTQLSQQKGLRLPAEWEEQSAVMLTWPHAESDWKPYLADICQTYVELAEAITRYEHLVVAAKHPEEVAQQLAHLDQDKVHIYSIDSNDTWARDHGPVTLIDTEGGELHLLDFRFNGWGEKFKADKDNLISRQLHAAGGLKGQITDHNDFVLEGGSIETDGRGTLFTTAQCLLAPHRNQPLDEKDIEVILKKRLHIDRMVWLHHGELVGDDTDGHIDTIVRCAPDDTLLYVTCDESDAQYADLKALENELKSLRTSEGKAYKLMPLPTPRPIYDGDDRLPATYANFLIINGAVLLPTYNQPDNDSQARQIVAQAFPDREVIGIDARTIIRQHGSIHCLTMQLY